MVAQKDGPKRRFDGLDALRGLAAILVVCHHIDSFYPIFLVFRHGYLGVDIFFMLSGFVIAHVYESRLASGRLRLFDYAKIRVARLYPMIVLSIALGGAYALYDGAPIGRVALLIGAQAAMVPLLRAGGDAFPLNPPQWSLFYELAVNAVHALTARYLTTARVAAIALVSGILFAVAIWHWGSASVGFGGLAGFPAGAPRAMFGFFAGVLIYRLREDRHGQSASGLAIYTGVVAAVLLPAFLSASAGAWVDAVCVFVLFPLAVWLAAGVQMSGRWRSVAEWAGLISFPLYAVQQPVIEFVAPLLPAGGGAKPVAWIALLVLLCFIAWGIEVVVDAPLRNRLKPRVAVPHEGAAATAP